MKVFSIKRSIEKKGTQKFLPHLPKNDLIQDKNPCILRTLLSLLMIVIFVNTSSGKTWNKVSAQNDELKINGEDSFIEIEEIPGSRALSPLFSEGDTIIKDTIPRLELLVDETQAMQGIKIPTQTGLDLASRSASFSITYVTSGGTDPWGEPCLSFPSNAKTAFNYAANIWAATLNSNVPITIRACWASLDSSSTLGYSGGGSLYRDFSGAPVANTWYSSSLVNAIRGSDIDASEYDMHITYNTNFSWYYGTDANPPSGTYDLVTVAAHEIAHGLGFSGTASVSGSTGSYGYGTGYPSIYDRFMKDGSGNLLTSYTNYSTALGTLLRSNNLWFHGPDAMAANGGSRVKIYAPTTWSSGSSYSHLDYTTFNGSINSMMVYVISSASANHNTGPVTRGLLTDLGWPKPPPIPPAPTGVVASDGTYTDKVRVSWNSSSGATYYQVYRNTTNSTTGATQLTSSHVSSPYDNPSAIAGTTYYYWLKACNTTGCSGYSVSDSGWRSPFIPTSPTGLAASDGTYTDKVRVSWNSSSGATYYQIYRNSTNSTTGATQLTGSQGASPFDDTSAVTGTTYYYWVKACGLEGCSGFSATDTGWRAHPIPTVPTGVIASDGTYTDKVRIDWNPSTNATYNQVYRNTTNSTTGATQLTGAQGASPFDDTSAVPGTTYYYWVKACHTAGCSEYSSSDSGWRLLTVPSAPTGVVASDGTFSDKVRVSWNTSSDATYYQVFRNTSDDTIGATQLTGSQGTSPYDDTAATIDVTYSYWVKACNEAGCSDYSTSDTGWQRSNLPLADAGPDQAVDRLIPVTLDGSGSSDPDFQHRSGLIIGAPSYDNDQANEGRTFCYYSLEEDDSLAWTSESDQADGGYGHSVSSAGDVNGDGFEDIIIGALITTTARLMRDALLFIMDQLPDFQQPLTGLQKVTKQEPCLDTQLVRREM